MASGYHGVIPGEKPPAATINDYWSKQVMMVFTSTSDRDTQLAGVVRKGMTCYVGSSDANEGIWTNINGTAGGWRRSWNIPWGIVGVGSRTTAQSGISALGDVGSLTVTWTAVANRRYRTSAWMLTQQLTAPADAQCYIVDGVGTAVTQSRLTVATNQYAVHAPSVVEVLSAGVTTRKVQATSPAGTMTVDAAPGRPAYIVVEDIGPSGVPA